MALNLNRLRLNNNGLSTLSLSSFMYQYRDFQTFQSGCLQHSPLANVGKYEKCNQLKIRKTGYNYRMTVDQLMFYQPQIQQCCQSFRSLTHAEVKAGNFNVSKPQKNLASACFRDEGSFMGNSLPSNFISKRFFSVSALQKVNISITSTMRSNDVAVSNGNVQNGYFLSKVFCRNRRYSKSAVACQLDDDVVPDVSSSLKHSPKRSRSRSVKPKKKVNPNGECNNLNVGNAAEEDVVVASSVLGAKSNGTILNAHVQATKNKHTSKKGGNLFSDCSKFSGAAKAQEFTEVLSRGKKPITAGASQTSQSLAFQIQLVETMPVANNDAVTSHQLKKTPRKNAEKSSRKKNVAVVKSGKVPKKQNKAEGDLLLVTEPLHISNSKATSRHSSSNKQQTAVEVRVQKRKLEPLYPPNGKSVVVVESLTKAKVIQNYLGDMYEVLPSYGHVRDLAARSGSVRPDDDFSVVWEIPSSAWTHLQSIKVALHGSKNLILASDPDREGEAIAWHICETLQQHDALHEGITVARVAFHEITESSIKQALQAPRDLDANLVHAYLARRALDYLIGFNISPLLWRKLPGCQSAGRVQSAALSLICDRETEIEEFKSQEYWTIGVDFHQMNKEAGSFLSQLTHLEGNKLGKFSVSSQAEANAIKQKIFSSKFFVADIKQSQMQRNQPKPYITSSLHQDAANKLQFTAVHTMMLAQKLYEGVKISNDEATGLITYMRTDGLHVSDEAVKGIQSLITKRYGHEFVLKKPPRHVKVKNAQEAHEAIRPTDIRRLPSMLVGILDEDSLKLYALIWSRTMASQMEPAVLAKIQVDITNAEKSLVLRSSASKVAFLGYQALYKDKEAIMFGEDDIERIARGKAFDLLYLLEPGNQLHFSEVELNQHHTEPPPRFSEAVLVKKLEELGIGRPSTYASVIKVLQDRNYVVVKNRVLLPEFRGRMVSAFLSNHFSEVTDYTFTADMESELDNVSAGTTEWKGLLKDYWARFSMYCEQTSKVDIRRVEKMLEETFGKFLFAFLPNNDRTCPSCLTGTLVFKVSRFGAGYFIGCDQHPKCKYIAKTVCGEDDEVADPQKPENSFEPKLLGVNPSSDEKVYLKKGPYGFYIQVGENRRGYTPKRASIPQIIKDVESISLEDALQLLRYPITLGKHPADGRPVVLGISKHGFSVRYRRYKVDLSKNINPENLTLEKAIKLLGGANVTKSGRPKDKSKGDEDDVDDLFP